MAVLALGGGLLLGPVLPAQANEESATGPADTGPVATALDAAHDLVSPAPAPKDGEDGRGRAKGGAGGHAGGHGKARGKAHGEHHGKGRGKGKGRQPGAGL
ncbi:hypothetical protein ACH4UM_38895 [Streptomyces sp. NPDC020801]|uniref:hypothetical protein n=1 Tax=Streptomyces sp. NPDC020801 TaxID=3365093 RepID=UPI00378E51F9